MADYTHLRKQYEKAKRDVQNAEAECEYREKVAQDQESHLGSLLDYREECIRGLRNPQAAGLSMLQMREYKLLKSHLAGVIGEQQSKLVLSQRRLEDARDELAKKVEFCSFIKSKLQNLVAVQMMGTTNMQQEKQEEEAKEKAKAKASSSAPVNNNRIIGKQL